MDKPATLLYGYAIENAVKGLLVRKLKLRSSKYKEADGWSRHDLVVLFKEAAIGLTKDIELLLRILTAHIVWAGK